MPQGPARLRVVIDTDAANEIDDQFAIAWALRSSDVLRLEGVHAAPFSHGRYFEALALACERRGGPTSDFDRIACALSPRDREAWIDRTPPALGMERSYEEILRVFDAAEVAPGGRVVRGADDFLPAPDEPVASPAVDRLIALARTASPEDPIHVATIGAPTNVASALLVEPAIAPHLRVLFVAGYPSGAGLSDDSFNLVQDRFASNVLFESDVPLVYLPGYQVAELLQLSLPAARAWLGSGDRLARYLFDTYCRNPINPRVEAVGRSWVLWDMITTAWLLDPSWVPSRAVERARVDETHRWLPLGADAGTMLEAYGAKRNEIFEDFFTRLGNPGD